MNHYELGEYRLKREEMEWGRHNHRTGKYESRMQMVWVLRKNDNIMLIQKTKEDMILDMMIWAADAMEA
tara:strand:+ start:4425 stop:4631 length:207 start_codon:yes stop_codon:yes gene_type:complete